MSEEYSTSYFVIQELKRLSARIEQLDSFVRQHMEKEERDVREIREQLAGFRGRVYGAIAAMSFVASTLVTIGARYLG